MESNVNVKKGHQITDIEISPKLEKDTAACSKMCSKAHQKALLHSFNKTPYYMTACLRFSSSVVSLK